MNELFPIFLKVHQLDILLIGGGEVAEEKLHFLLKSSPNANVQIVAKEVSLEIDKIVIENTNVNLVVRPFESADLKGKQLVIAATNNPRFNDELRTLTKQKGILLNVADKAQLCDFYLGGIVTKGDLKLAISTNGSSPILAKRLRQFLENEIPNEFEKAMELTAQLRKKLKGSFKNKLKELNQLTQTLIQND